MGMSHLKN